MSGYSSTWTRRLAMATVTMSAVLGIGSVAPAVADTTPTSFALPGPDHPSKEDVACLASERACEAASRPPGPRDPRTERDAARKGHQSPGFTGNAKANGHGTGEVLWVTEPEVCVGESFAPDLIAQSDSRDPLVISTTDRFQGALPPVGDGTITNVVTREHDAKGNLVYRKHSRVGAKPNVITCGYDGHGRLIARTEEQSIRVGLTVDIGKAGSVDVEHVTYDSDRNGTVDHRRTISYVHDEKGRQLLRTNVLDNGADGTPDSVDRESATYDSWGLRLVVQDTDFEADGAVDRRETAFAVRDSQGRLERFGRELDWGADGTADNRSQTTVTYNSHGVLIREVYESDHNADGIPEFLMVTDFTYNLKGQVERDESTLYYDHPFDAPEVVETRVWHYDARGEVVHQVLTSDWLVDGVVDLTVTVDYTHDQHGNVVEYLSSYDGLDYDTSYRRETTARDARGNILEVVLTEYDEGQEATAAGWRDRFQYDPPGN